MRVEHSLLHKTRHYPRKCYKGVLLKCRASYEMVVVTRGEPGTRFELVDTNRLWVIKRKGTTQAVADLKEALILREFIRFIRGHTGEPKHRPEHGSPIGTF